MTQKLWSRQVKPRSQYNIKWLRHELISENTFPSTSYLVGKLSQVFHFHCHFCITNYLQKYLKNSLCWTGAPKLHLPMSNLHLRMCNFKHNNFGFYGGVMIWVDCMYRNQLDNIEFVILHWKNKNVFMGISYLLPVFKNQKLTLWGHRGHHLQVYFGYIAVLLSRAQKVTLHFNRGMLTLSNPMTTLRLFFLQFFFF